MLTHPELVKSIEKTLSARGVRKQDLADGVADVRLRALGWLQARAAPADLASFKKLCNAIAVAYAKDAQRKRQRRAPYDTGPCEDPDAYVADAYKERQWDPIDTQRLLDILEVHLRAAKMPECAFTILDAEAAGMTHAEIGEELGLTDRTVRCQLARMRDGFRDRVAKRGLSVLAPGMRRRKRRKHR
jgi:DNA-directed RNA polymerase specialized sigma24 family protein